MAIIITVCAGQYPEQGCLFKLIIPEERFHVAARRSHVDITAPVFR